MRWPNERIEKRCEILQCLRRRGKTQTFFEEAELENTDAYVRMKHGKDFPLFSKEILPSGQALYRYDNGSVTYCYEFTEI